MMTDRAVKLQKFLAAAGWSDATRSPLAGDASNRRYDRLVEVGQKAVLMDAPPEKGEDVRPFVKIARHLSDHGLSAPEIYAEDAQNGFLILEDLGDDLFARVLTRDISQEITLYLAATDALIKAQRIAPPKDLGFYGPVEMAQTAMLAVDWYLKYTSVTVSVPDFQQTMLDLLDHHLGTPSVLVQRDYHAENLLWLPGRIGAARVGLLDFQDAQIGHPAYDLASLLKDARRDVSPAVQAIILDHFIAETGSEPATFNAAFALCSAQRNLRIIGVFTRLCVRDGKDHYPDMIPRVWKNLMDDLTHPALGDLRRFVQEKFPAPSPETLTRIKAAKADA